jgi:transcriptional regulator with XRE-family HTH domain
VRKLKRDLCDLSDIDEKIKSKMDFIKNNPNITFTNANEVKALKNNIYERTSRIFVYNLKKLIQHESTQKNLAKKIGVSEDLLSKYKSGEAFPSIETLVYICNVYNLTVDKFITEPLDLSDIEVLASNVETEFNIFEEKYYVYFQVTNIHREGALHEGTIEVLNNDVTFKILSNDEVIKAFTGSYSVTDKLLFFNLHNPKEGNTYINMIKPNVNKNKYVGGLAMLLLPSDANSKPCAQKLLFSKLRLDRDLYYKDMKELLNFSTKGTTLGHVKISQSEDEAAYNFISNLL